MNYLKNKALGRTCLLLGSEVDQMVSKLSFNSHKPSSNPAEVYKAYIL